MPLKSRGNGRWLYPDHIEQPRETLKADAVLRGAPSELLLWLWNGDPSTERTCRSSGTRASPGNFGPSPCMVSAVTGATEAVGAQVLPGCVSGLHQPQRHVNVCPFERHYHSCCPCAGSSATMQIQTFGLQLKRRVAKMVCGGYQNHPIRTPRKPATRNCRRRSAAERQILNRPVEPPCPEV
jgi:hypothetical protein